MSTEDQKRRQSIEALAGIVGDRSLDERGRATYSFDSWGLEAFAREVAALMSNAAPEIDMSAERVEAARRNALEQAAKVVEDMRDLKEAARAQKAADEAISRDDKDDMLHRLRHCSTVSLFNGALERAAKAIRVLADPLQGKETPR